MKNLLKFMSILGILVSGFGFAQSSNEKTITDVVSILEKTIITYGEKKIDDRNIDDFFKEELEKEGYAFGDSENKEFEVSENFLDFQKKIFNLKFDDSASYVDYLKRLQINISALEVNNQEKEILNDGILFQIKVIEMANRIETKFSDNNTSRVRVKWRCIGGMAAGHMTGLIAGCGSIGSLGASVGGWY